MRKLLLASIVAFCAPFGAQAAIYTQTYTGTVLNGVDIANEFGGIDLTGQTFVATYTYDSQGASAYNTGNSLEINSNDNVSPNVYTSFSVNGYTVNFVGNRYSGMEITAKDNFSEVFSSSLSSSNTYLLNYIVDHSWKPYGTTPYTGDVVGAEYNVGQYSDAAGDAINLYTLTYSASSIGTVPINVFPAVPEAATWAMMLAGFGLVGTAMRRRRTIVRFA